MKKKVTAVLTAIVLTVTSALANPFAYPVILADTMEGISASQGNATTAAAVTGSKKPNTIPGGLKGYHNSDIPDKNKLVTVIVELDGSPLLDRYIGSDVLMRTGSYSSFDEFSKSAQADAITSELRTQQDNVINQISHKKTLNTASDVLYHYTTIMNGFAIRINYGAIDTIKKISGVKTAYVAPLYNKIDPVMDSSTNTIGASALWDLNYKGQGTTVAIIDTGLDVNHPGFSVMPVSPKYADASFLQERLTNSANGLLSGITDVSNTFVNTKIPYAYDYADKDINVVPSPESIVKNNNEHGTHVAGTVAAPEGDSDNITGVAPEAQLMIMKVFSDTIGDTSASTENILAAIEDSVVLGADVINMSLGSSSGFTDEGEASVSDVYNRVESAGITMAVSAGNSYNSTYQNGFNGSAFSSNPDTSVVGSPSTYMTPLSVASVVNTSYHAYYFETDGTKITYTETAAGDQPLFSSLSAVSGGAIEYVPVPGIGNNSDYAGINVDGKIALVNRGGIAFNDKLIYAKDHGAAAIVVSNNTSGTISMAITDYSIPAVSITQADGNFLRSAQNKILTISGETAVFPDSRGNTPSDFSSLGVTPDLKLKPEIAAPGENIYSTLPDGKYGSMSGTSMASPHIAGAYALMKQYLNEKTEYFLTSPEKAVIATDLLMSTAVPSHNSEGIPYSPRKQGSGIVNVYNAINSGAYLYTDDEGDANGRPKLNLGDDKEKAGTFTKSFHIRSISGSAITYVPKNVVLSESVTPTAYGNVLNDTPTDISDYSDVSISVNGATVVSGSAITLNSEADLTVDVTITLKEELKQQLNASFENGIFIDGYLTLVSDGIDLSIPFMGFYGDWTQAPLFDSGSATNLQGYQQDIHALYSKIDEGYSFLGVNPFDDNAYSLIGKYNPYMYSDYYDYYAPCADTDKIAISPNKDGNFDSLDIAALSLLRNAKALNYQITDADGNSLLSKSLPYERKTQYQSSEKAIVPTYLSLSYDGWDSKGAPLPNNSIVTFTVNGELDYSNHSQNNTRSQLTFPITIDTQNPSLLAVNSTEDSISLSVQDNQYVAAVMLYNKADEENSPAVFLLDEDSKGQETELTLTKEELPFSDLSLSNLTVTIYDYAMNSESFDLGDYVPTPSPTDTVTPTPTDTITPSPTDTVTPSPTDIVTPLPTVTITPSPTDTVTPTPTATIAPAPTDTVTPLPTVTATPSPTVTITPSPTNTITPSPTDTVTPSPTSTISPSPTDTVTPSPTGTITPSPTDTITPSPTSPLNPTPIVTATPTPTVTAVPTPTMTPAPTKAPDYSKNAKVSLTSASVFPKESTSVKVKLSSKITDKDTLRITYSSTNKAVATVSQKGVINALSSGTVTINVKVTVNNNSTTYKLNLTVKTPYITFTKKASLLNTGTSFTYKAIAYGIKLPVTYSLSNTNLAVIDEKSGKLTAIKPGVVYITAKAGTYTKRYKLRIK